MNAPGRGKRLTSEPRGWRDAEAPVPWVRPRDLNILLITVDCLRADMPWAGYPRPIAPKLTELEKRAVSYTHAYALSSYTSMSLGGLLGGQLPGRDEAERILLRQLPRTT